MIWDSLEPELQALDQEGLTRRRRLVQSPVAPEMVVDGQKVLAFCSNDYLGLASHPEIARAMAEGALHWGAGAGASHLVSGHLEPHHRLEEALAAFVGQDRALYFSTGYMANLAMIPALVGRGDGVFADKLNHASLIDAVQLSRAHSHRYRHQDLAHLESLLAKSEAPRKLIVSDTIFSMDGDAAPLAELQALADKYDAWLVIDDAHGFGVAGPQGRGSVAALALPPSPRRLYMGTLGKAAGVSGAFVAGHTTVMEWLLQKARPYIFTTASSPAVACALLKSLELIEAGDARRQHLAALIGQLRQGLAPLCASTGWQLMDSATPIQPLVVGSNQDALALTEGLLAQGIWVPAIRPPTVPQGQARLRITLCASHTPAQVEALIGALEKLASRPGKGRP